MNKVIFDIEEISAGVYACEVEVTSKAGVHYKTREPLTVHAKNEAGALAVAQDSLRIAIVNLVERDTILSRYNMPLFVSVEPTRFVSEEVETKPQEDETIKDLSPDKAFDISAAMGKFRRVLASCLIREHLDAAIRYGDNITTHLRVLGTPKDVEVISDFIASAIQQRVCEMNINQQQRDEWSAIHNKAVRLQSRAS